MAINWCVQTYPDLPSILKADDSLPDDWVNEVMGRFDVARRTARDYLFSANAKLKLKERSKEAVRDRELLNDLMDRNNGSL